MNKRPSKAKISKIFRLEPALVAKLEKEATKTKATQTAILEKALSQFLSMKRGAA